MSRTVPCKTSSGIERQRLPPVQFAPGPAGPAVRMGLTKGSRRPLGPAGLGAGCFSGAGAATSAVLGAGVAGLAGTTGVTGFTITAALAGVGVALAAALETVAVLVAVFSEAGVGVAFAAVPFLLL